VFAPLLRIVSLVSKLANSEACTIKMRAFLRTATFIVSVLLPLLARLAKQNVRSVTTSTLLQSLSPIGAATSLSTPATLLSCTIKPRTRLRTAAKRCLSVRSMASA